MTLFPFDSIVSCWRYAGKRFRYWLYGITPTVCAPKKSAYQTQSRPMSDGQVALDGVSRKCSSIAWKPASSSRKPSGPIASIVERPIAESIE